LAKAGVPYANESAAAGTLATVRVGDVALASFDGQALPLPEFRAQAADFTKRLKQIIADAGYPATADSARINFPMLFLMLFLIGLASCIIYGPLAAWLVELFPARIRYTSMSLPYHIGNGWFGGFLPTVSFALIAYTGNIYQGLWYPVIIALATFVIGGIFLRETKGVQAE
jgi:MFS family permease